MQTVRMSREQFDGSVFDEVIAHVAARTGFDREAVESVTAAYLSALLKESGGDPVVCEEIGAVLVPEDYPNIKFIIEDEPETQTDGA